MSAVPVKISGVLTKQDGTTEPVTIVGGMSYPDVKPEHPIVIPPDPNDPHPEHPIVIPPDAPPTDPDAPHPEHPIVLPPDETTPPPDESQPPLWIPVWIPGYGWVSVSGRPHPTPSRGKRR
jgi:hypothetical protein